MVRCHNSNRVKPTTSKPPVLHNNEAESQQTDYIALFLGDDEDQSTVDRSVVTFLAVPAESLEVYFYLVLLYIYEMKD